MADNKAQALALTKRLDFNGSGKVEVDELVPFFAALMGKPDPANAKLEDLESKERHEVEQLAGTTVEALADMLAICGNEKSYDKSMTKFQAIDRCIGEIEKARNVDPLRLIYWNGRGLMEVPRQLLASKGSFPPEWEDVRVKFEDTKKPDLGYWNCGRMPILEDNGTTIGQGPAIRRYLAAKLKMMGGSPAECGQVDTICETVSETVTAWRKIMPYGNKFDDATVAANVTKWLDTKAPEGLKDSQDRMLQWWLNNLEQVVGANGFAVGQGYTLADAMIYNVFAENEASLGAKGHMFLDVKRTEAIVANYPKVAKICANWKAQKGVAKWLDTRGAQLF